MPSQEEDGFTLRRIAYVSYSWAYSYSYYIIVGTVPEVVIAIAVPDGFFSAWWRLKKEDRLFPVDEPGRTSTFSLALALIGLLFAFFT